MKRVRVGSFVVAIAVALSLACGSSQESEPAGGSASTPAPWSVTDSFRVALVGLDGATWGVIDTLLARSEMPNLQRVIDSGTRGTLRSLRPSRSPRIWTSIATGVGPKIHGILDFVFDSDGQQRLYTSDMILVPTLWEIVSASNVTVGVTNYWFTYPAQPVDGYVISDHTIPSHSVRINEHFAGGESPPPDRDLLVFPPDLWDEIAPIVDTDRLAVPDAPPGTLETRFQRIYDSFMEDETVMDMALAANRVYAPRLTVVYFKAIDRISHNFWRYYVPDDPVYADTPPDPRGQSMYGDAVVRAYRHADVLLGELLDTLDPNDVVLVVSDHGFDAVAPSDGISGGHGHTPGSIDGIYAIGGGPITRMKEGPEVSVYDITPTLLQLLGVPIPPYVQGKARTDLMKPAFVDAYPAKKAKATVPLTRFTSGNEAGLSEAEKSRLEKLKSLGYIQ